MEYHVSALRKQSRHLGATKNAKFKKIYKFDPKNFLKSDIQQNIFWVHHRW